MTYGPSSEEAAEKRLRRLVDDQGGTLTLDAATLFHGFKLPQDSPESARAIETLLWTVGLTAAPAVTGAGPEDSITLSLA